MVIVPALLMVSTIRFRSFKSIDLQTRRPFRVLLLFAVFITLLVTHPQWVLVTLAYGYLSSGFIGMAWSRLRRRPADGSPDGLRARHREHPADGTDESTVVQPGEP
jgi:CDP-diacylglycerol--serine O-phosphatidyltransferase